MKTKKLLTFLFLLFTTLLAFEPSNLESIAELRPATQIKDNAQINYDPLLISLQNFFKKHEDFVVPSYYIITTSEKYNLNPEIILAIAILESGYGTSKLAKTKKNFFGIAAYDENPTKWASDFSEFSLEDAIERSIVIIKKDYFEKDKNLDLIAKKYSKDKKWAQKIREIRKEIEPIFKSKAILCKFKTK